MLSEVKFSYKYEDARSASQFLLPRKPSQKALRIQRYIKLFFFLNLAIVLFGAWKKWPEKYLNPSLIIVVVPIILGWLILFRNSLVRGGLLNASPKLIVRWDEAGIELVKRNRTTRFAWADFESIVCNSNGIFLRLRLGDGILIPRRVFLTPGTIDELTNWFSSRIATTNQELSRNFGQSVISYPIIPASPEERRRFERWGMAVVALGFGSLLIFLCVGVTFFHRASGLVVIGGVVICHLLTVWGTCLLAKSRGFRIVHGLIGLIPLFGLMYVVSRAKPKIGECVNRQTWRGFLTAPFAPQSEISSWHKEAD